MTPEQFIELCEPWDRDDPGPPNLRDLVDVALGPRFPPGERRAARVELARLYERVSAITTRDPMSDLMAQLALWAEARRFDDDQNPATDTPDERLVRSYLRWQATR